MFLLLPYFIDFYVFRNFVSKKKEKKKSPLQHQHQLRLFQLDELHKVVKECLLSKTNK